MDGGGLPLSNNSGFDPGEGGFDISSMADLDELRKALNIGYSSTGNDVMRVESLESTLRVVSYQAQHVKFWNRIYKIDAYSNVQEYNRLDAYGSEAGGFNDAGELPEEEDSTYSRESQNVKYVGTTRAVAHPTTLIRTIPADAVGQETANGVLWMLGKIEFSLFEGDADIVPQEWNGVRKQIENGGGNIIDLRGARLQPADVENAADLITNNFGTPSLVFAASTVFSLLAGTYNSQLRWNVSGGGQAPGMIGTPLKGQSTQAGDVPFETNIFLKRGAAPPAAATSKKAPNPPTVSVGAPGATTGSKFVASDAGSYKWEITALNRYGESAPTALSTAATIAAGDGVTLTITDGGGVYPATGYKLYRSDKTAALATVLYQTKIARTKVGGVYQATTAFLDINTYIQGCYTGYMLDLNPQNIAFNQLSPLIKMPLALISPAIRWMQLLYGTPIVYAPKRQVVFRNMGA